MTSVLTIPFLIGFYVPVGLALEFSLEGGYNYYYSECLSSGYNGNTYTLESCLSSYMYCMQSGYKYSCASSFQSCIRGSSYGYDCGGLEMYSVMQFLLASLAFLTDIILIVVASKHHKCCGTSCCTSCESSRKYCIPKN